MGFLSLPRRSSRHRMFPLFWLVTAPFDHLARAQQQHVHNWQAIGDPIEQPYIWLTVGENPPVTVEYLRCGQVARLNVASILDWDNVSITTLYVNSIIGRGTR
jgi:hypothetical protein